jgi:nucleoside 2-deoxyribosyltransferase
MARKRKIYFAAPLFGLTERKTNRLLAETLEKMLPDTEVLLPQSFKYEGRFNAQTTFGLIFKACLNGLDASAAVVALLDGADADSGTAFEVGYAYAKGIPIIGVRTDYRPSQEKGVNLMLSRSCTALIFRPAFDENHDALCRDVARALKRIFEKSAEFKNGKKS